MKKLLVLFMILSLFGCSKPGKVEVPMETNIENLTFNILEEKEGRLDLIVCRDSSSGGRIYVLKLQSLDNNLFSADVDTCIINDSIRVGLSKFIYVDSNQTDYDVLDELTSAIALSGFDEVKTLDFIVDDEMMRIELPEHINPGLVCDTFHQAKADEQVILENDVVKVTLKGLGNYIDSDFYQKFEGLLLFENKSEQRIPVGVIAAQVNGIECDILSKVDYLDAGLSRYVGFEIIDAKDIDDIYKVSLLIMSDEKEQTGTVRINGGTWYDVTLSKSAPEREVEITGELVFEEDGIEVYYQGQTMKSYTDNKGYYYWNFLFVNRTDEDVEIWAKDSKLDNKTPDSYLDFMDKQVGANGWRNAQIYTSYSDNDDCPTLSFKIQLRSRGGGSILYDSDQVYTFRPEINAKDDVY